MAVVASIVLLLVSCSGAQASHQRAFCKAVGDVVVAVAKGDETKFAETMNRALAATEAEGIDSTQAGKVVIAVVGWKGAVPRPNSLNFTVSNGGVLLVEVNEWCMAKGF